MNNQMQTTKPKSGKLSTQLANRFNVEPNTFITTVKSTCFNGKQPTNEQFVQFLMVANEYELNPFLKEIYAFPTQGGGIQPIVGIDGWLRIINRHPDFDGMEFVDHLNDDGKLTSVTCRMYRKDRSKPTEVTEYMNECIRGTQTWKQWPARMLRHKATIQAARYAFGFSGIVDPDEADRIVESVSPNGQDVIDHGQPITNETKERIKNGVTLNDLKMIDFMADEEIKDLSELSEAQGLKLINKLTIRLKSKPQQEQPPINEPENAEYEEVDY